MYWTPDGITTTYSEECSTKGTSAVLIGRLIIVEILLNSLYKIQGGRSYVEPEMKISTDCPYEPCKTLWALLIRVHSKLRCSYITNDGHIDAISNGEHEQELSGLWTQNERNVQIAKVKLKLIKWSYSRLITVFALLTTPGKMAWYAPLLFHGTIEWYTPQNLSLWASYKAAR